MPAAAQSSRSIADDAAVGEQEGDERSDAGAGRFVHGAGEERIGAVGVALEQMGEALDMEHVAAKRTGRAESIPGDLGVASHLPRRPLRHRFARR